MKGETASELAGFARAMREKSVFVDAGGVSGNDVIGHRRTAAINAGTFNISTVAAIILAERARTSPNMGIARSPDASAVRTCSKRWACVSP